jgi:hypothetical protein
MISDMTDSALDYYKMYVLYQGLLDPMSLLES